MTVDRRLAVKATRSFYKKLKALRWYSFIGMQKRVARRMPSIITVSDSSKTDISKEFKIPASRLKTVPIGIDLDNFFPLDHVKKEPGRLIVTNSADTPLKGLYHLLYALKGVLKHRNVSLTIIGTPKKNGGIENLVKTLDLARHIDFTGRIDHQRFVREYAKAQIAVVVITSYSIHYTKLYDAGKNVEWAVIETGMGGRFDATNIITPKVSVITNLSLEHRITSYNVCYTKLLRNGTYHAGKRPANVSAWGSRLHRKFWHHYYWVYDVRVFPWLNIRLQYCTVLG